MTDDASEPAATRYRGLLAQLETTTIGADLTDENRRRHLVFQQLQHNENPVLMEVGQELGAGNISLRGAGEVPAYAEALRASLDRLADLDLGAMSDRLETFLEAQKNPGRTQATSAADTSEQGPADDDSYTVVITERAW